MDDPIGLATTVVAAVSGYLARFASGVLDRAAEDTGERLYQLVAARLQASQLGSNLLQRLQQQPDDASRGQAVALALADEIGKDPEFREALATSASGVPQEVMVSGRSNIVNTGAWDNRQGVIATGNAKVDRSRHIKISLGGFMLVILAVIVLSSLATTAIVISIDSPSPTPGIGTDSATFPELQGNWYFQSEDPDSYKTTVALHITGDTFRVDLANVLAQRSCSGTMSAGEGRTYYLNSTQGVCPRTTLTLQSDNALTLYFGSGDTMLLRKE